MANGAECALGLNQLLVSKLELARLPSVYLPGVTCIDDFACHRHPQRMNARRAGNINLPARLQCLLLQLEKQCEYYF